MLLLIMQILSANASLAQSRGRQINPSYGRVKPTLLQFKSLNEARVKKSIDVVARGSGLRDPFVVRELV
ncbi:MAG TPA: hypothetical protein VHS31_18545 [Tepidisphaeraceae bacterium]|nr:hypothetical protein [Tepidisphaeraceae bacterium]